MSNLRTALPREVAYLSDAAHLLRQTAPETAARLMRVRNELLLHAPGASNATSRPLSDAQRQNVCTACGNILVPGRDGDTLRIMPAGPAHRRRKHGAAIATRVATRAAKSGSDQKSGPASVASSRHGGHGVVEWGVTKIFTCGRCRSVTRIRIPAPPRVTRAKKGKARAPSAQTQTQTSTQASAAVPASAQQQQQQPLEKPAPSHLTDAKQSANAASKQRKKSRKAGLQALLAGQKASAPLASFTLADFRR